MVDRKAKGYGFTRAVCDYLTNHGWPYATLRSVGQAGADILQTPGVSIECKNVQKTSLGMWLDQAVTDCELSGADIPLVIHKRRGVVDPAHQFATTDVQTIVRLLHEAGYGNE